MPSIDIEMYPRRDIEVAEESTMSWIQRCFSEMLPEAFGATVFAGVFLGIFLAALLSIPHPTYHYCFVESQRTGSLCFRVDHWSEGVEIRNDAIWYSVSLVTKDGGSYSFCEPDLTYRITGSISEEMMENVIG